MATATILVPILVVTLRDSKDSYKAAREEVVSSVKFWADQNKEFRTRLEEDFSARQSFYTNIMTRQNTDLQVAAGAVDGVFQARQNQRLAENVFEEALNAFDAFTLVRFGASDPHLQKPRGFDAKTDEIENEYADALKTWIDLLQKLERDRRSAEKTSIARLSEKRVFWMIIIKLNWLHDVSRLDDRRALCKEIEALLEEYDRSFVKGREEKIRDDVYPDFSATDFHDLRGLARKIHAGHDPVSAFIGKQLSGQTKQALEEAVNSDSFRDQLGAELAIEFKKLIWGISLYDKERFSPAHYTLRPETVDGIQKPLIYHPARLNRMLLEDAYPSEIAKYHEWTSSCMLFPPEAYPAGLSLAEVPKYEIGKCRCYLLSLRARYHFRLKELNEALKLALASNEADPDRKPGNALQYYPNDYLIVVTAEALALDAMKQNENVQANVSEVYAAARRLSGYFHNYPDRQDATYLHVLSGAMEWYPYSSATVTNELWGDFKSPDKLYSEFNDFFFGPKMSATDRANFWQFKENVDSMYWCLKTIDGQYKTNYLVLPGDDHHQGRRAAPPPDDYMACIKSVVGELCSTNEAATQHAEALLGTQENKHGIPIGILLRLRTDIKKAKSSHQVASRVSDSRTK
ncbi:MAG: hypothetical protein ACXWJX_10710 [Limisphaerales bacterium]